ncbi:unnamed protein product [Allacma fusca]|uniref:Uncharacterized protein n=1 Tax=Allacma fusca TaxID=39272 RepID=A0A8J2LG73_9HEXA|nr:unnamed protein product [Allacma fusca]
MEVVKSRKRRLIYNIFFSLSVFHCALLSGRLIQLFFLSDDAIELHLLSLTLIAVSTYNIFTLSNWFISFPRLDLLVVLFQESSWYKSHSESELNHRQRKLTIPDRSVVMMPQASFPSACVIPLCYLLYPTMPFLAISCVPEEYQTIPVTMFCLAWDTFQILMLTTFGFYFGFVHLNFLNEFNQALSRTLIKLRWTNKTGEQIQLILKELKALCLQLEFYNLAMCNANYGMKLVMMIMGILGIFSFVRLFAEHSVIAAMNLLLGLDCLFFYPLAFGTGFVIPEKVDTIKAKSLLLSKNLWSYKARQGIRVVVDSIPTKGIKEGEFHTMQRDSTLNYFSFVFEKVVDLLLTF